MSLAPKDDCEEPLRVQLEGRNLEKVVQIAESEGIEDLSVVISRAIALHAWFTTAKEHGYEVCLKAPNGDVEVIEIEWKSFSTFS